ncbi:hypothetical protein AMELA_G00222730, partial [Ameiurus melas]
MIYGQVLAVLQGFNLFITQLIKILHCDLFWVFCINLNMLVLLFHTQNHGVCVYAKPSIFVSFLSLSPSALNLPVCTLLFEKFGHISHSSEG